MVGNGFLIWYQFLIINWFLISDQKNKKVEGKGSDAFQRVSFIQPLKALIMSSNESEITSSAADYISIVYGIHSLIRRRWALMKINDKNVVDMCT